MNKLTAIITAAVAAVVAMVPSAYAAVAGAAAGAGPVVINTAGITGAIDTASIIQGIGAIAALVFGPRVARWGFKQIMAFLKG